MNRYHDDKYFELVENVLRLGTTKGDRTGTGTISTFGQEMRFDISDGSIPLLTTKKMHIPSIIHEILWYLSGSTNIKYLVDNGVRIWREWADENGELGKLYGYQWRYWPGKPTAKIDYSVDPPKAIIVNNKIDQIQYIIDQLKTNPDSRRLIVSAWNPTYLPSDTKSFSENVADGNQALPPCHYAFQFYVNNNKLSCKLTMRSCDVFLGTPFNIAQYSILTHMIAQIVGMETDEFIFSGGDVHIYQNHISQYNEQIKRTPYPSPTLQLNKEIKNIDDFKYEDFKIINYKYHPTIRAVVAV